jgi:hypothetical protein
MQKLGDRIKRMDILVYENNIEKDYQTVAVIEWKNFDQKVKKPKIMFLFYLLMNIRKFTLTTIGYDPEGPPRKWILKLNVTANDHRHAVIKANRQIKYRNFKEIKAGGNRLFNYITIPEGDK